MRPGRPTLPGLFDVRVDPHRSPVWDPDVDAPVSGLTPAARHASATGAQAAAAQRSTLLTRLLEAFYTKGRLTLAEAALSLGKQTHSITSTWRKLEQRGWIEGLATYHRYTTATGHHVKQEYHGLTERGRAVAVAQRHAGATS